MYYLACQPACLLPAYLTDRQRLGSEQADTQARLTV